ncbi:MAG: tRNA pseudouridine(55) synthase TruB [Roseovarius sp.]|nr:tRNA pseudouridine(55) synthase TruB [Roseovarius sp.]
MAKGRDISGWLVVDKPVGMTSTAATGKVRRAFQARKAGHAGTLDPLATGVLPIALGEATKTMRHVAGGLKSYSFKVRLGIATNTDDAEGQVAATSELRPDNVAIKSALEEFTGNIMQVPPKFSAIKIGGERSYKLARDGDEFEIGPRPLFVRELLLKSRPDPDHVVLEMTCGKGGYVRSIARDLGEALGCFGHVASLHRTKSGPFKLENGIGMEIIEALARDPELDSFLMPLEDGLASLPEVHCTKTGALKMRHGNPGEVMARGLDYGEECWASYKGRAIAIGQYKAGEMHPARVFNRARSEFN